MLSLILAFIIIVLVIRLMLKNYKPQPVLLIAGFFLMVIAIVFDFNEILSEKESTGFAFFDIFELFKNTFSMRIAGLGLNIMVVGGFARYMDSIGASRILVHVVVKLLKKIKYPYVVLSATYVLGQLLGLVINSASGLGLLLMVTMFPVLVSLGVSKASAAAVIATTLSLDWSPTDAGNILAANMAQMEIYTYWLYYQIPVSIVVISVVAIMHFIIQQWYDKKEYPIAQNIEFPNMEGQVDSPPLIYILLPLIPFVLIVAFNDMMINSIRMDMVTAIFISIFCALLFEFIRYRNSQKLFADLQVFFNGMGTEFTSVVTLIIAGEIFSKGLQSIGAIDMIINLAHSSGFSSIGMILIMVTLISICTIIMGGNSSFFAFASLAPVVATKMSIETVLIILPMHFASSIVRNMSPIAAVIMVVSNRSGLSPIDVVRRTIIPMLCALIANVGASLLFFYR